MEYHVVLFRLDGIFRKETDVALDAVDVYDQAVKDPLTLRVIVSAPGFWMDSWR